MTKIPALLSALFATTLSLGIVGASSFLFSNAAVAQELDHSTMDHAAHHPVNYGLDFLDGNTPVTDRFIEFHDMLLYIIVPITIIVLALLLWVALRYNKWTNKTPSSTSHNTLLEVVWTAIPVLIVAFIAVKSIDLLYYTDKVEKADITIKTTGHQWYWAYEYPDYGDVAFDSLPIPDDEIDASKGQKRLMSVDEPMVVPAGAVVKMLITSNDVIHSWGVASLGVKKDAVPGSLHETWFRTREEGTYFGHCYEICGPGHAYMPIEVRAVSEEEFKRWVKEKGGEMPVAKSEEPKEEKQVLLTQ